MTITYPIARMTIGNQPVEFSRTAIIKATVTQELHPISLELPVSTAEVTIYTTDARFSPFSDSTELFENMPVDLYEVINGVETLIGRFYLDEWHVPEENQIVLNLHDAIGVLGSNKYLGGFWSDPTSFFTIVGDIVTQTGISYSIDPNVNYRTVKGWIPPGTLRDALQQICFAARCRVRTDRMLGIYFEDALLPVANVQYPTNYYGERLFGSGYFSAVFLTDEVLSPQKAGKQKLTVLPLITEIVLTSHDYYFDPSVAVEEIFNGDLEPGIYEIPFSKPYFYVFGEGAGGTPIYLATENGLVIATESSGALWPQGVVAEESSTFTLNPNYVTITLTQPATVKIYGQPYWVSKKNFSQKLSVSAAKNTIEIANATLISSSANVSENVQTALQKVGEFYDLRYQQNIKLFPTVNRKLGDIQVLGSWYNKQLVAIITRISTSLTGGFILDTELVGKERII